MTTPLGVAHVRSIVPKGTRKQRLGLHSTPAIATRGLLSVEKFQGTVWEPACGVGKISEELKSHGLRVFSSDLVDRGYGRGGVDFLTKAPSFKFNSIVTNPPFELWADFARRCAELRVEKFALVGRLGYLEGRSKRELFQECRLFRVWSMYPRVNIAPVRYKKSSPVGLGGMVAFAWYVFEPARAAWPPEIDYVDLEPLLTDEERELHRRWARRRSRDRSNGARDGR